MNRGLVSLVLLAGALATSCGGSSSGDAAAPAASSSPSAVSSAATSVTPMPGIEASPAPAGFPVGGYTRVITFAERLDGKWALALKPDGTYVLSRSSGDTVGGAYSVPSAGRLIIHGEVCPATFTYKTTTRGITLTDTGDCDDADLHTLFNGEWSTA